MAIDDVDPEDVTEVSLRDHLEAALANASDETARFHMRQALQHYVKADSNSSPG